MLRFRTLIALAAASALVTPAAGRAAPTSSAPTLVASPLSTPWEMVKTSATRVLVTERPGTVTVLENGVDSGSVWDDTKPFYAGDGALKFLGLELDPDYPTNKFVYLYETIPDPLSSRIVRLTDDGDELIDPVVIFDGIGSDNNHDGGRIKFGPDDLLYVTTGDIHDHARPRNIDNFNGKILRMEPDGDPAPGNSFNTDGVVNGRDWVYSYGHRHPQGLAWDADDRLWETEHGPSNEPGRPDGAESGRDELNLIVAGGDYGWPAIAGEQSCSTIETQLPKVQSGPAPAWAPSDLEYVSTDGFLYAPALNGEHLHVFKISGMTVTGHKAFDVDGEERLRSAMMLDESTMWIATHTGPHRIFSLPIASGETGLTPWSTDFNPGAPEPVVCPQRTEGPITSGGGGGGGGGGGTTPASTTQPGTVAPAPAGTPLPAGGPAAPVGQADPVRTLLQRFTSRLQTLGLRRVLRTGSFAVRAGGFDPGSVVSLRLQLRRNGRTLTVASGRTRAASRAAVLVRARLTRRGRAALKRASRARLTFRLTGTPPDGAAVTRTGAVTVTRAGQR
jgi:glucose/arabinose dehydrogenase